MISDPPNPVSGPCTVVENRLPWRVVSNSSSVFLALLSLVRGKTRPYHGDAMTVLHSRACFDTSLSA